MRWPATFGAERIELIERLSSLTGYGEPDLCRALRGISVFELQVFVFGSTRPQVRAELDQRVSEARRR